MVEREGIMVVEVLHALGTRIIDVASQGPSGINIENIQRQHLFNTGNIRGGRSPVYLMDGPFLYHTSGRKLTALIIG